MPRPSRRPPQQVPQLSRRRKQWRQDDFGDEVLVNMLRWAVRLLIACFIVMMVAHMVGATEAPPQARGIRNHNPGNITAPASGNFGIWPGAIGVDEEGYLIFKRRIDGLRALVINLKAYRDKHGLRTPYGIIKRWTRGVSPSDQKRYAETIALRFSAPKPNIFIKLDMWDPSTLEQLTHGIVMYECGSDPYEIELYRRIFPQQKERRHVH
jgi:hypothetical protein